MVPFSDTIGGDIVVWDPEDVKNDQESEYGIYVLPDDSDRITFLTDSFSSYVTDMCLGSGFDVIAHDPAWAPPQEFVPFGRKPRVPQHQRPERPGRKPPRKK
jgi:hypothetical protein